MLSAYRVMWIMVFFDLPVDTRWQRKQASRFRLFLLDQGFEMYQYSVYLRHCIDRERTKKYTQRIRQSLPEQGLVNILYFTDKQYKNMTIFDCRIEQTRLENPTQFVLL